MKKLILLLSIVAAFGIGGVSTASAAGNCHVSATPIYYSGSTLQVSYNSYGCTDVDMVEYAADVPGFGFEGLVDHSNGNTYPHSPPTVLSVKCGRQYTHFVDGCGHTVHVAPYCGGLTHKVTMVGLSRVHGFTSQQWSGWFLLNVNQDIWC